MSLLGSDYPTTNDTELTPAEEKAWKLYCKETARCMSTRDFWWELSLNQKLYYLDKANNPDPLVWFWDLEEEK